MKKSNGEIAVIGMSGRFPGANNISEFWQNLCQGKESIYEFSDRELKDAGVPATDINNPAYVKAAPLLADFDKFDPAFFKISPVEAELMDPQLRLLLQCAWEVLEDAGCASEQPQNIGVFTGAGGVTTSYLANFINLNKHFEKLTAGPTHLGNDKDFLSTYISYKLNLTGPSVTVQTACSTSLVALHIACSSLLNGECDMAMAGGVSVRVPHIQGYHYKEGYIFSKSGHIRTFDAAADGVVFGSGLGLVLVKRLEDAIRDNNQIYAVIKSSAIANDGKGKMSYAASSAKGQVTCITRALERGRIKPGALGFVESHGTGTAMGDPEEVKALTAAFKTDEDKRNYCALGALKANIGHLEAAAGIAAFIKAVLVVKQGVIPPLVNFTTPNPRIKFEKTPFYVNDSTISWPQRKEGKHTAPRCAGVNSLGVGGTNAFVVIEEYIAKKSVAATHHQRPVVIPVSAKTRASLNEFIRQLSNFIALASPSQTAESPTISRPLALADLAYTLQTGRMPMSERAAFVVSSLEELQAALKKFLTSEDTLPPDIFISRSKEKTRAKSVSGTAEEQQLSTDALLASLISEKQLQALAQLWVDRTPIDWRELYSDDSVKPRQISLPTYVFAKQRYWIDTGYLPSSTRQLHPLLHSNTSNLDEQSYSAIFTGEEFFLDDHQIRMAEIGDPQAAVGVAPTSSATLTHKVLPGVAYLEMARAAVRQSLPTYYQIDALELRDIVWVQPLVVNEPRQVSIALIKDEAAVDAITFEIYSQQGENDVIHCQGKAILNGSAEGVRLDLAQLNMQMDKRDVAAQAIYPIFTAMGLHYGPAYRGITAISYGSQQLLARLSLQDTADIEQSSFELPPGLMDSAFQSSVLLIAHLSHQPERPLVPFLLDSVKIISPCTMEMHVWTRLAEGSSADDRIIRIDMDLCNLEGEVCIQVRGLAAREISKGVTLNGSETPADNQMGNLLATPHWQVRPLTASASKAVYAQRQVILFPLVDINVDQLEKNLGDGTATRAQCEEFMPAGENISQRYYSAANFCFAKLQAILRNRPKGDTLIQWIIANDADNFVYCGLEGLLRTASLENPQVRNQMIITDSGITTAALTQLLLAEQTGDREFVIKYEQQQRAVKSWKILGAAAEPSRDTIPGDRPLGQQPLPDLSGEHGPFKDQGVYLITGGRGGLGTVFAKEIIRQTTHAKIILTGRSADAADPAVEVVTDIGQQSRVEYRQLDLANLDQVKEVIAEIKQQYGQLNGIIHSAGMVQDNFILKKTRDEFSRVLTPKVNGTFNLDVATRDMELDFLLLFSSLSSAVGNVAQADYAAANGFMDQFSAYRNELVNAGQRQGLTLAINWPLWQDGGMGLDEVSKINLYKTVGIQPMSTATGLHAFYRSMGLGLSQTLVAEGELARITRHLLDQQGTETKLLPDQPPSAQVSVEKPAQPVLVELTRDFLRKQFSVLLKLPFQQIDPESLLENYGIDSILALDLTGLLEKSFGPLPKTLFFEYLTISELAAYFLKSRPEILARLLAVATDTPTLPMNPPAAAAGPRVSIHSISSKRVRGKFNHYQGAANSNSDSREPIAIIGLSGRYPEAKNIEEFWFNLRDGKDCIIEVPADRWNWQDYYSEDRSKPGHHYSKWGGFIDGVDEFDARFFNISPLEAETIDPQERLFLQHVWMAIEDAGYTRAGLQKIYAQAPYDKELSGQVGVYAGVMYGEYQLFGAEKSVQGQRTGFASNLASIANRVSYVLNLHGPSMALDTMCSSSLTAIHLACQDLHLGRTGLGIAGGVNITIHPNKYLMLSAGQFISSDGHCQSFGEGGDGYIPGEGVGVVILKRLSEAERDGNPVYGVIKGSALSHGGKTNGYTVPNPQAQASAVSQALTEAGVDPRRITYIEAHGTGTKLGDPIEIAALSNVFRRTTADTGFCLIGSAKSNIGHCEAAAGIAGLTKVLLQMKHQQIVPSLHSAHLNPHIDFDASPFVVNQSLKAWEQPLVNGLPVPRIAGISSFGAGGSNAHLIVEEYQYTAASENHVRDNQFMVPLSARTADQLQQKAQDLLIYLQGQTQALDLASIAYTLQQGREAMSERLGFLVTSVEQLVDKLEAYIQGKENIENCFQGNIKTHKDMLVSLITDIDFQGTLDKWLVDKKFSKLVDFWAKGLDLDWTKLYVKDRKPRFISLPTYPFAKQSYWIAGVKDDGHPLHSTLTHAGAYLHPLLHRNTSDLSQNTYSSNFSGREFFVSKQDGRQWLPIAAFFEMARAAVEQAAPAMAKAGVFELRNTLWVAPVDIANASTVNIALADKGQANILFEIYTPSDGDDFVYCQGEVIVSPDPAPPRINPEQLTAGILQEQNPVDSAQADSSPDSAIIYQNKTRLLAKVNLSESLEKTSKLFVLHPEIMSKVLLLAGTWLDSIDNTTPGQKSTPSVLESLRVISPCAKEMLVSIRISAKSVARKNSLDIDLLDQQGNSCVQITGLGFHQAKQIKPVNEARVSLVESHSAPVFNAVTRSPAVQEVKSSVAKKILLKTSQLTTAPHQFPDVFLAKPETVSLARLEDLVVPLVTPVKSKPQKVALADTLLINPLAEGTKHTQTLVSLYDKGEGVFALELATAATDYTLSDELIEQLLNALATAKSAETIKVLVITGDAQIFLQGDRDRINSAIAQGLYRQLADFPYPTIAILEGNATGAGFLFAALCDLMICNEEGRYQYTVLPTEAEPVALYPSLAEDRLFQERFGANLARDFLYLSRGNTAKELRNRGWSCPILPKSALEDYAHKLTATLAGMTQDSLSLLKQHLARHLLRFANELSPAHKETEHHQRLADGKPALVSAVKYIRVKFHNAGVVSISLIAARKKPNPKAFVAELTNLFTQAAGNPHVRSLVLISEFPNFMPYSAEEISPKNLLELQAVLLGSSVPVTFALTANATGVAWLISQSGDACVYHDKGIYSTRDTPAIPAIADTALTVFSEQLGQHLARYLLVSGENYSGLQLQEKNASLITVAQDQVVATALTIAEGLAEVPQAQVTAWRNTLVSKLREKITALGDVRDTRTAYPVTPLVEPSIADTSIDETSEAILLNSTVIKAHVYSTGIAVVTMEDREARNMFSEDFNKGMEEVFARIGSDTRIKVVVLTGYDNYFALGGNKETLLAIQQGKAKFTDNRVFELALQCRLPVIAAMQGHGFGAGWALGMFADFIIMSEESKYISPYMNYGFTPGAGATLIFKEKIGYDLARDTLFTGREYSGSELKDKGISLSVLMRKAVLPAAMSLARKIAELPLDYLLSLKSEWTQGTHAALEETYARELAMHAQTFVGRADTLQRILQSFSGEGEAQSLLPAPGKITPAAQPLFTLASVRDKLKALLAYELRMDEQEIDEDIQFIDLGLDSITGVTWIRKINEEYNTAIEAIKVYTYSTLSDLSRYVKDEAEKQNLPIDSISKSDSSKSNGNSESSESNKSSRSRESSENLSTSLNSKPTPTARISQALSDTAANTFSLSEISAVLRKLLADELRLDELEIDKDSQFIDLGLDSITGVTWIRKINEHFTTAIEAIKVYSYPTLAELSRYVKVEAEKIGALVKDNALVQSGAGDDAPAEVAEVSVEAASETVFIETSTAHADELSERKLVSWRNTSSSRQPKNNLIVAVQPIAVIGMAGQFPKANSVDEFWQNLSQARDCVSEVPAHRWDINAYYQPGSAVSGKTTSKWMGALEEYDLFDPLFFNISPKEAKSMDPQQRLFLQSCWQGIEDAGYNPKDLSGSKCGVFAGCSGGDYHQLSQKDQLTALGFTGSETSILAARISYFLNLTGPCLSIDTACSSSLVAIAIACDSLCSAHSDLALAGGVNVMAGPGMHIKSAQAGMLSPDGKCYTFDQKANGFVPGESVGVVLLKRLADAQRDRDCIYGIIQGWGINQDGKTNGITAPNADSQTALQQGVFNRFQIDPAHIQLIEAHGTGTPLGDPIEISGLKAAFGQHTRDQQYCALGSVKSNIGHCLTAAGIAGFIKLLQAIKHRQLPPTIHFSQLNEHIKLEGSPFYINHQLRDWPLLNGAQQRQAAISSFGFSGTNAFLVVAEPQALAEDRFANTDEATAYVIPLSARTEDQLQQKVRDLNSFIQHRSTTLDLAALAYTLQVGREPMGNRLALIVNSLEQLAEKLKAYIAGSRAPIADLYQGQVEGKQTTLSALHEDADFQEAVDKWVNNKKLAKLAELWVKGLELDWKRLYISSALVPQRISLPAYPFAKERYWFDENNSRPNLRGREVSWLHPLLHSNTSTLSQQSYSVKFTGEEFFLTDVELSAADKIRQKTLSQVVFLEMARAAVQQAVPQVEGDRLLVLRDICWAQAFVVKPETPLTIALFATGKETIEFEIISADAVKGNEKSNEILHCLGKAEYQQIIPAVRHDLSLLQQQQQQVDPQTIYTALAKAGVHYAPACKNISAIYQTGPQLLAQLGQAETMDAEFLLHPALMAGTLQACMALSATTNRVNLPLVPVCITSLRVFSACTASMFVWAQRRSAVDNTDQVLVDIDLCDEQGFVCVEMRGLLLEPALQSSVPQDGSHRQVNFDLKTPVAAIEPATIKPRVILSGLQENAVFEKTANSAARITTALPPIATADLVAQAVSARQPSPAAEAASTTADHRGGASAMTVEHLQQELIASLADALYMKVSDISPTKPFVELGLDSIVSVEWIATINKKYTTAISATRVYDYPNVKEFAVYLLEEIELESSGEKDVYDATTSDMIIDHAIASTEHFINESVTVEPAANQPAITSHQPAVPVAVVQNIPIELLQQQLRESLAEALYLKTSDILLTKPFIELGLDSILGVEWIGIVNKQYGTNIAAIRVYDYPNIEQLAAHVQEEITTLQEQDAVATSATSILNFVAAPSVDSLDNVEKIRLSSTTQNPGTGNLASPKLEQSGNNVIGLAGRSPGNPSRTRGRFLNQAGIHFQPKYDEALKNLYFYSPNCSGNFAQDGDFSIHYTLTPESNICLQEHQVFGEHLFPTDAYLELVYAACKIYFSAENISFKTLSIVNPLLGFKNRRTYLKLMFRRQQEGLQFFISSSFDANYASEKMHLQGYIVTESSGAQLRFNKTAHFTIEKELAKAKIPTNAGRYYAPLQKLSFGESIAVGVIELAQHDFSFLMNPFVAYGGLCTVINCAAYQAGKHYGISSDQFLPYKIHNLWVSAAISGTAFVCYAELKKLEQDSMEFYLEIADEASQPVMIIESIILRRVSEKAMQQQVRSIKESLLTGAPSTAIASHNKIHNGSATEGVAIIGMSCRYPMSENVDAFWENLQQGRDCISEVPADRWKGFSHWYHPDPRNAKTSYSKWGGFLESIDNFDPLFFGIAPSEAEIIDPQQRIFLEECWKAIESAGYAPGALSNQFCGVYVGCAAGDYTRVLTRAGMDTLGAAFMGSSTAILAARISYHLNLKGPSIAIDTACSSSLTAVHLACESIRHGDNQMALAGGINLLATPLGHILTSQVGMPSKDGKCFAFDQSANGIVFSEGCGVILLKSLSHAIADKDNILGVITGSGINQDGKTNGITAPSANAQEKLLNQIYTKYAINPEKISYIEAHGTGTALGDPIEVNALTAVFKKYSNKKNYCALGSVKSNIGHTGFAAGVASIIKVLLAIKHRKLVPSINFANPNAHISFDQSPFYVNTRYQDWESSEARVASVSSFGFSGTNAHIVIEEFLPRETSYPALSNASPDVDVIIPLSAKTQDQLWQKAQDLLMFSQRQDNAASLSDIAYTLQSGRDAMEVRLGMVVNSKAQLVEKLSAYIAGHASRAGICCGELKQKNDALAVFKSDADMQKTITQWFATKQHSQLLELWVKGLDLDWSRLYEGVLPQRISLPTYPFARERCWVDGEVNVQSETATRSHLLHPLVHANASTFSEQSYSSVFTGDEFFLADHRVKLEGGAGGEGERVLPGVAYLEMARAAIEQAMSISDALPTLELRNIIWAVPIVYEANKQIITALLPNEEQQIDFEIRSNTAAGKHDSEDVIHCQGQAMFIAQPSLATLNINVLKQRMMEQRLTPDSIYAAFTRMGLNYGRAHRGIVDMVMGKQELLVTLALPTAIESSHKDFVLHPSVLDSALQATIALTAAMGAAPSQASLPFALDSILILSPCTTAMYAWVRYAQHRAPGDRVTKYDLDLCDLEGNVCVQIKGFSTRQLDNPVSEKIGGEQFNVTFYEDVVERVLTHALSVEEAAELG